MEIEAARDRVPLLRGAGEAVRLGGMTNHNYRIGEYVLRLPGPGTSEYIDRAAEEVAARSAADAGVNVPVVFFDAADGLMVTAYLDGTTTMTPEAFGDPAGGFGAVRRAGDVLRRLHTTAAPFAIDFELFPAIDDYKRLLSAKQATLPDGYDEVERQAGRGRAALARHDVSNAPSHCDPLCENFLDDGDQMWLIDYEYAGNNDPMWDLGDLSVEGAFSDAQDDALLDAYFGGPAPALDRARMVVHKAMCDVLWSLWGILQHVNGNPVEDFWAYGVGRFERCRALMSTDRYAAAVATLEGR